MCHIIIQQYGNLITDGNIDFHSPYTRQGAGDYGGVVGGPRACIEYRVWRVESGVVVRRTN